MVPSEHNIFLASSLKLKEQRETVEEAINSYNEESKDSPVKFTCFRYETNPEIIQAVDLVDAQRPVDAKLYESSIFFLIIEDNIGSITEHEFRVALNLFRNGKMPAFIFIFRKKGAAEEERDDGTLTYKGLLSRFGLITHFPDESGELVPHFKVYDIPFDDMDSLKSMVLGQLRRLPAKLPPVGSKLGLNLEAKDFYSNRKCSKAFYTRRFDDDLREEMGNRKMILVTGYSLSGKTRSVMEALQKVCNGSWVYVIGDKSDNLAKRLKMLKEYLLIPDHVKLCIEIDNLDQHVDDDKVFQALQNLVDVVMKEDSKDMIVATASDFDVVIEYLQLNDYGSDFYNIKIPQLTPNEYRRAIDWFRSYGVDIMIDGNTGYMQIGALFVNLSELKAEYRKFLKQDTVVRQSLLKAIKAQSIWRDDAFGNKALLRSLTEYFAQTGGNEGHAFDLVAYTTALKVLCEKGLMGVTPGRDRLNIEEYVYKYVIGYDGEPTQNSLGFDELVDLEKELAEDIIKYCDSQRKKGGGGLVVVSESLTRQVSKIMRRCDHQAEIVRWFYELWSGNEGEGLAELLQSDRKQCEELCKRNPKDRETHFYSGVVRMHLLISRINRKLLGFEERIAAYERVPEEIRVAELFAALVRSARTSDEIERIRQHADYEKSKRFGYNPITVLAEMRWANDFWDGYVLFKKVNSPCEAISQRELAARLLKTDEKPYDLFFYGRLLRRLALMASTEEDFDRLCKLLRQNFVCLISDRKLLAEINNGNVIINANDLTLIELMVALGWQTAIKCAVNVFGNDLESCEKLELKLLDCVGDTLKRKLANELQVRMVVSAICAKLIYNVASQADYEEVYDQLFKPLEIDYPFDKKRKMIFRNAYTYTAMMKCRGADVHTSMNLYTNDLIRHAENKDNPLFVTNYTLNKLLSLCKGEKRMYLDQINGLYDKLELKRDTFTYNILLENAPDWQTVENVLRQMRKASVEPDLYTYLNIQRNNDVDFHSALRLLLRGDCDIEGYHPPTSQKNFVVEAAADDAIRKNLHQVKQAWINLFRKRVGEEEEKEAFKLCLEHLRKRHRDMLQDDNVIYNIVLRNDSFIASTEDTIEYVNNDLIPLGFDPDDYTVEALLYKVLQLHGEDRKNALEAVNDFIKKHPACLNKMVISQRIKLFRTANDPLNLVFFDGDGNAIEKLYTPYSYIQQMVNLGIPLDSYAIINYTDICDLDDGDYQKVGQLLKRQSDENPDFEPITNDIRAVRERILPYCDDLPEVYGRKTSMIKNKNIAWKFKKQLNKDTTLEELKDALESLDWNDSNSALCSFNDILDKYILQMRDEPETGDGLFDVTMENYKHYVIGKSIKPSSITLNLLAKSLTRENAEQKRSLLIKEVESWSEKIVLHPHILGELARTTPTIDYLIELVDAFTNMGCKLTPPTADTFVYYMNRYLMEFDKEHTEPIMNDLFHYVFDDENDGDLVRFEQDGLKKLLLNCYKDSRNISDDLLHSLLFYNNRTKIYDVDDMVQRLLRIFPDSIADLMNRLVKAKDKDLAKIYVPILFDRCRNYSDRVLKFLVEQLPNCDTKAYDNLLEKLYTFNCTLPESSIPILLQRLPDIPHDPYMLGRLQKVYTHIALGYLRQGDMLMRHEKFADPQWCHRSFDCIPIRDILGHKLYINLVKLLSLKKEPLTKKEFQALRITLDNKYPSRISEGIIGLKDLSKLPGIWWKLWEYSSGHWKPKEQLVLAMVRAYAANPYYYAQNIENLYKAIAEAKYGSIIENEKVWVRYESFGPIRDAKASNLPIEVSTAKMKEAMPHPFVVDLCRKAINTDWTSTKEQNVRTKMFENDFVKKTKKGLIAQSVLNNLPPLLIQSNWLSSRELLSLIPQWHYYDALQYFGQFGAVEAPTINCFVVILKKAEENYTLQLKWKTSNMARLKGKASDPKIIVDEIRALPNLWSKVRNVIGRTWNPDQELVLAIIDFFAIVPDLAMQQIVFISDDLFHNGNKKTTRIRYGSLDDSQPSLVPFIPVATDEVEKSMPHPYIVNLCKRIDPELIEQYENDYYELAKEGSVNPIQLSRLHILWKRSGWIPNNELKQISLRVDNYKQHEKIRHYYRGDLQERKSLKNNSLD